MNFKDAVTLCLKKRFYSISGRASRPEFWYFTLFCAVIYAAAFGLTRFIPVAGDLIFAVIFIMLLCPLVTAAMRRLHDLGLNGAIAIAPIVMITAAVIFADLAMRTGDEELKEAAIYTAMGFFIITLAFIGLFMRQGQDNDNRYGKPITSLEDAAAAEALALRKRQEKAQQKLKK